jgi:small subunit ribosomal protein S7
MPRRRFVRKRTLPPDPVYNSELVSKFINKLMLKGKKSLAERIFYQALEIAQKKSGEAPLQIFQKALQNVRPYLAVKPRRVGGATYQVPVDVPEQRGLSMAMKWIIQIARERKGKSMQEKLAAELMEAAKNSGLAVKKKEDTHKMAEANRAFAHYRW